MAVKKCSLLKLIFLEFLCIFRKVKIKKFSDNLQQNICGLFHVLVQFLFARSETELDYYHQKLNVRETK